ncbi:MAG: helix-turn-helix transcriptional regulator [Burkholderiales bacterium]
MTYSLRSSADSAIGYDRSASPGASSPTSETVWPVSPLAALQPAERAAVLTLDAIVSLVGLPALVIDAECRVLSRNRAAARWLEGQRAMSLVQGRISWRSMAAQKAFASMLWKLAQCGADAATSEPTRLQIASTDRVLPLIIDCRRLDLSLARDLGKVSRFLLILHDLQDAPSVDRDLLVACFGLSPSESRVAGLLAEGESPSDIALILCVSMNTVRTHLRRISAKLGVRRQSDVVRMLTQLPALAH